MGKLVQMQVVIMGLRGLGVEIAKNLILAGPKSVHIYDPTETKIADLGANFYLTEEHVKNKVSRSVACRDKLQELNPNNVEVKVIPNASEL
jgi:ubiquitin-activating enzyme E1